jgi:hypothetical protein
MMFVRAAKQWVRNVKEQSTLRKLSNTVYVIINGNINVY